MEFRIFRYRRNEIWKQPENYYYAYYFPKYKVFMYYACSLITDSDGTYLLKGPDEWLKQKLDKKFKKNGLELSIIYGVDDPETKKHYTTRKWVGFKHPDFVQALEEAVNALGVLDNCSYTANSSVYNDYIKVNSAEDVKRLDEEYAKTGKAVNIKDLMT